MIYIVWVYYYFIISLELLAFNSIIIRFILQTYVTWICLLYFSHTARRVVLLRTRAHFHTTFVAAAACQGDDDGVCAYKMLFRCTVRTSVTDGMSTSTRRAVLSPFPTRCRTRVFVLFVGRNNYYNTVCAKRK